LYTLVKPYTAVYTIPLFADAKQLRNPLNRVTTRASRRQLKTLMFLCLHYDTTFSLIPTLQKKLIAINNFSIQPRRRFLLIGFDIWA